MSPQPRWTVFVGESEGMPLLIRLNRAWARDDADRGRPWAVTLVLRVARVDHVGLPAAASSEVWDELQRRLSQALTGDGEWAEVARLDGEGVIRLGFYAAHGGGAVRRAVRAWNDLPASLRDLATQLSVSVQADPTWSAYARLREQSEAADRRTASPPGPTQAGLDVSPNSRRGRRRGETPWRSTSEEQPWRGEELQRHPDEM